MYRVNKKGKYNIPFAHYKTVNFNSEKIMDFARKLALANITILSTDYQDILAMSKASDVVYCDPPYMPLSKTSNFSQYTNSAFGTKQQEELVKMAEIAAQNGATVLISNHDTPDTRMLYANARIVEVSVRRSIGAHASTRKCVNELIAIYSLS